MDGNGSGATLDNFFKLGSEYIRTRFGRTPDASQQDPSAQAVPVPAATVAQAPASSAANGGLAQYVPMFLLAAVALVVVGIVLKKAA